MKRLLIIIIVFLTQFILAACSSNPEIIVVEITRPVSDVEQVEVTRIVEVEKEVTRIVEVPFEARPVETATPDRDLMDESEIDFLQIELWPDYDRPSVLVLLTGAVPAGATLPVTIAVPIPEGAEINAVAEIGKSGMTSIDFESTGNAVIFESKTPGFRVEYYAPYLREGSLRTYGFEWPAPFSVAELAVQIQRPFNASEFNSEPAPSGIFTDPADGLDYFLFNSQAVPQGTPYRLDFSYGMASDVLSADELSSPPPELPGSPLHDQQALSSRQT